MLSIFKKKNMYQSSRNQSFVYIVFTDNVDSYDLNIREAGDISVFNSAGTPIETFSVTGSDGFIQSTGGLEITFSGDVRVYNSDPTPAVTFEVDGATGDANFAGDVDIAGDLTITGDTTEIETTNTAITDNVIVLNKGEAGAGVTLGTAGIEVERGTETNKTFVWDETTDKWTLGAETLVAATVEAEFTGVVGGVTPATVTGTTITANTGFIGNVTGNAAGAHTGTFDGDMTGTMSGDDSTILVDGVNNKVVGDIETASLRTSEEKIAIGKETKRLI